MEILTTSAGSKQSIYFPTNNDSFDGNISRFLMNELLIRQLKFSLGCKEINLEVSLD